MKYLYRIFFFVAFFVLYYYFSFDKISFGDCVGYVLFLENNQFLRTAASHDHFLYTNTAILFNRIINNPILALKLLSVLSAVASLFIFFKTVRYLFKEKLAYFGTLLFAISFSFWRTTETIEICTFNTIFQSAFLYFTILYIKEKKGIHLILSGLILGMSLWSHVQNIMMIPAYFYLLLANFPLDKKKTFVSLTVFLIFSLGLFIPAYLYSYSYNSVYSSDNPVWIQGTFNKSILQYLADFVRSVFYVIYNFWFFTLLGIYSLYHRIKKITMMSLFLSAAFIPQFLFGTFYNVSDNYVYFIGAYQIFILLIVDGIVLLSEKHLRLLPFSFAGLALIPVLYILSYCIALQIPQGKNLDLAKSYKGGLKYYLFPWMNNNVGILEFTIDKKTAPEPVSWMTITAEEYILLLKSKGYQEQEIRKF